MQSLRLGLCWTLSWNFYLHHPKIWQDFIQTLIWCCAGKSGNHFSSSFGRKTKTFLIFRKYTLIFYSIFAKTNCKLGESTKRTETDFGLSNPTKQSLLCLPLCWLHRMSIDSFCEQPSKDNKAVTILITGILLVFVWGRNPTNTTQQLIFSHGLSVLGKHNRAVTFLFLCLFVYCCWEAQQSSNFAYLWRWPHRMFVRAGRGKHCSTSTATSLTLLPHYLLWGLELVLSPRVLCFTSCAECKSFIIGLNLFSEIES